MRKFYSLVLMATALLIGTNAWAAKTTTVTNETELIAAWQNAEDGDIIQLNNDIDITKTLWLGTQNMTDDPISIKLDLNGKLLRGNVTAGDYPTGLRSMFVITHGALNVVSSIPNGRIYSASYCLNNPNPADKAVRQELFRLSGSDDANGVDAKTATPFTHLTIGEGVIVEADALNAIAIDAISRYFPNRQHTGNAVMAGANVEKYNAIELTTYVDATTVTDCPYAVADRSNGVRVDISGSVKAKLYALKVNGEVKTPSNRSLAPYIYIHPTGDMYVQGDFKDPMSNADPAKQKRSIAVYASGYARFLVEGTCAGATGLLAKSGEVVINDATISSNCDEDYKEPNDRNAGTSAHGSAVVIQSTTANSGDLDVTIEGDTKLTATNGYALEESVTAANSKVVEININGGTFEGGNIAKTGEDPKTGTIIISTKTTSNQTATIEINGANVSAKGAGVSTTDNGVTIGGKTLEQYLAGQGQSTHITYVDNGNGTTMVISDGEAPKGHATIADAIANDHLSVKLTGASDEITSGIVGLDELEINEATAQVLTINENATLKVGRVILGKNAKIVVKPGANLIVTGEQGIVAPVVSNIVIEASADKQGYFLFNPAVTSNKHPNATVEVYTNCKQQEGSYAYQRITIPVKDGVKPANDFSGELYSGSTFTSYAWEWNGYIWAAISSWSSLKPFKGYEFANNSKNGGVTYSFAGQLVGNGDAEYDFPTGGFDYFGCSHVAPIYLDSLFKHLGSNVESTVWIYDFSISNWEYITLDELHGEFGDAREEIKPMEAFVLNLHGASGKSGMKYASAIWGNPRFDAAIGRTSQKNPAPARVRANASNHAIINIVAENGNSDKVKLVEKDVYTAEFENGADASKLMFDGGINLYATTEAGNLSRVATDNLEGTMLSFRAGNDTQYTINFTNVLGEDYALRDNVTGQVITLTEGASYSFMQEANSTVPARFEIVGRQNMPTAIDNVEEAAKATGIYTITGQYLGRDFSNLPAGVYIVNGVKVVK